MGEWRSTENDLPPAPDGPVTVRVTCSTGPRSTARHPVTLHPDWSLTTPHDLEAERILAALGGTLSCLTLADVVVPTLRDLVQLSGRHRLAGVVRSGTKRWRWRVVSGSCRRCKARSFATLVDAVRHERTVEHWAETPAMLDAGRPARESLGELYDAVGRAHRRAMLDVPRPFAHQHVLEDHGMAELRGLGVPEEYVDHVHERVWRDGPPLPVRFYLAAAYLAPDLDWLASVARSRPEADVLTWAAWTETPLDRSEPQLRLRWLSLGVSTHDTAQLMHAGCPPNDVEVYAQQAGTSHARAATVLAAWDAVDCRPGPSELMALDRTVGASWQPPSGGAIDLLMDAVRGLRPEPTRTQAAIVLAAVGTRPNALAVLRAGARDPATAQAQLEQLLGSHRG